MRRVAVELPAGRSRSYDVVVGIELPAAVAVDLASLASPSRWWIVADDNVAGCGETLATELNGLGAPAICLAVAGGEAAKTRAAAADLQDRLLEQGISRDGWIVTVGGGVVGDLGGFVAATLFRGLPYVQVPTSLLAMVDSSVGGKTGVDTPHGKNLVGAFHQPRRVLIDVAVLKSLPEVEVSAGLAEVIKYGVILDGQLFVDLEDGLLESCLERVAGALEQVIARCVRLKGEVVAADERERDLRQILNFGHTVGHAVEVTMDYALRHGEAVAIGMVAEGRLAERRVGAPQGTAERIADLCRRAGLPTELPEGCSVEAVVEAARFDKKVRVGQLRCALPQELGKMARVQGAHTLAVEPEELHRALVPEA